MASFFPPANAPQIVSSPETNYFPVSNAGESIQKGSTENKQGREVTSEESWKLFKPQYGILLLKLCKECQNYLYNDKYKFSIEGAKAICKIPLCYKCYKGNVILNATSFKYFPWKKTDE